MSDNALESLGLTPNESEVYKYLLASTGQRPAQEIISLLSMDKVSVYRALKSLEQQGLIHVTGETRNQRYSINSTKGLFDKYDDQVKQLTSLREQLEALVSSATKAQHEFYQHNHIEVFKGMDGYRSWNNERLEGNVKSISEFGSGKFLRELFGSEQQMSNYMNSYIKNRVKKGISIRVLSDGSIPMRSYDHTSKKILKQQRVVDLVEPLDGFMSIFGDRFGFYTKQGGEYIGVIISDPILSGIMTTMFDTLWKQGEEV